VIFVQTGVHINACGKSKSTEGNGWEQEVGGWGWRERREGVGRDGKGEDKIGKIGKG